MAQEKPIYETSVRTDSEGNWSIDIPRDLEPGAHPIIAIDDAGRESEFLLYIQREEVVARDSAFLSRETTIDGTAPLLPPFFAYAIFFLFLLIIGLGLNSVRLGRKMDKTKAAHPHHHHYTRNAIIVAALAIAIAFIVGLVLNQQAGNFDFPKQSGVPIEKVRLTVSGSVVSPFAHEGVAAVDLVVGDTRIRTGESGHYQFTNVPLHEGIRLTHPELQRAISIRFDELAQSGDAKVALFPATILFDAEMFNTVIHAVNAESRGQLEKVYTAFSPEVRAKLSFDAFIAGHERLFFSENIQDQELAISFMKRHNQFPSAVLSTNLQNVIELHVENGDKTAVYLLQRQGEEWYFVK